MTSPQLTFGARIALLADAFLWLVFDGVELGLMPVALLSVSQSLLGDADRPSLGGFLFRALGGDSPRVGAICAMNYGLGRFAICFTPETSRSGLNE